MAKTILVFIFSSAGRSPGRAIVLPPASALMSALASAFRDNFSLIIDRFSSILPQVTGNGLNFIQYHPNST